MIEGYTVSFFKKNETTGPTSCIGEACDYGMKCVANRCIDGTSADCSKGSPYLTVGPGCASPPSEILFNAMKREFEAIQYADLCSSYAVTAVHAASPSCTYTLNLDCRGGPGKCPVGGS